MKERIRKGNVPGCDVTKVEGYALDASHKIMAFETMRVENVATDRGQGDKVRVQDETLEI